MDNQLTQRQPSLQNTSTSQTWAFQTNNSDGFLINRLGSGGNEMSISVTDASGVALAGIKALTQQVKEKNQRISELEKQLSELSRRMEKLESHLRR